MWTCFSQNKVTELVNCRMYVLTMVQSQYTAEQRYFMAKT